jgi:hypothetical protein
MGIYISVGEWMNTLQNRMTNAVDGDCFYLPTPMHLHAFFLVKEQFFAHKAFKVELRQSVDA